MDGMDLASLDVVALQSKLNEVTQINDFLEKENSVLSSYLHRHMAEEADDMAEEDAKRGRKGRGTRKSKVTQLTVDQKLDIAAAEHDAAKKETVAMEDEASRKIDRLRAVLQQTDLRIADLKREAFEFKRDVVVHGEDPRTGKIMAERVIKHFDDHLRSKDAVIDKLRLKNAGLRTAHAKAEAALRTKEEVGDVLHYIDFHQLQIENKQYLAKIEEKTAELARLKHTTGRTVQALNVLKARLSDLLKEAVRLRAEIRTRSAVLARLRGDVSAVAETLAKSQMVGETLARAVREAEDLPTVMDYLGLKAQQAELGVELTGWKRKVEILELAARQAVARTRQQHSGTFSHHGKVSSVAFGNSAPLGRTGGVKSGQSFAKSAALPGRINARGIGGFGGSLFSAKSGTFKSGTLVLGLPPAVRGGR